MRSKTNIAISSKEQVFREFETTFNNVGAVGLLDVKQDSPLVRAADQVFQHGLREPVRGYWSLVRSLTHSTTLKSLEAFVKYISSSNQKGLAWTFYTMEEGSLEYYLTSLLQDSKALQQHYLELSLLRDPSLALRVVTTVSTLRAEAAAMQLSMESSLVSEGPLDSTPLLTSPVDSGVALIDSDTERSEERQLATSVATAVSSSSDNTLADDNDICNSNCDPTTSSIMAQTNKYDGVPRRPRKKKKSESGKRVSFHQDSNDDPDIPITMRHLSNLNKFYVEGRYSWAGEGDSFFTKENNNFREVKSEIYERKGLSSSISIFESELGIEADCNSSTTTLDDAKNNIEIVCEKLSNAVKQSLGLKTKEKSEGSNININARSNLDGQKTFSMSERGVPEGQEDPGVMTEYEQLLTAHQRTLAAVRSAADLTSDSEWSLDTPDRPLRTQYFRQPGSQRSSAGWTSRILQEAPSKTSLVKRFLRSIPSKKPCKQNKPAPKPNLYIKGVKPDPVLVQDLLDNLKKEMEEQQPSSVGEDEFVTDTMRAAMREQIFINNNEQIYKVYRVAAMEGEPLLAVLTGSAIYMAGLDSERCYCRRHHITYQTLKTVVIGPEYQTVMLVSDDVSRVSVTVVSALGRALVTHMITHLAVAVLRACRTHLSVVTLALAAMPALCRALASQTSITKGEQMLFYQYIRVEDSLAGQDTAPSLTKSGHLMYRSHSNSPWLPGYIVLKGGILHVYSDASQPSPKHILSLECGYFGGCRRVYNSNRPHTFEILPFSQRGFVGTFQFAAADDYESSDWLQAFIQTSSDMCQGGKCRQESLVGCGLLLTSSLLLTLDFPDTVLSWVRVQDISTVRTETTCCILETSCREVQESGGDWILYFLTEQATSEFLNKLYSLRPELRQAEGGGWTCEALHSHCLRTSQLVRTAWDPLLNLSSPEAQLKEEEERSHFTNSISRECKA